jgi:hypothetical protein
LHYDRERKIQLCATHEVAELWLVDLIGRKLLRHRSPQPGGYAVVDELDPRAPLEAAALPGLQFEWSLLFL